jgi:hypothetical protein
MMFSIINLLNLEIYLEAVIMAHALSFYLVKRGRYALRLAFGTIVFGTAAYLIPLVESPVFWLTWSYSVLMYIALLGLTLLSVVFCVKASWTECLFCAVGGYAAHHFAGTVTTIVSDLLSAESQELFSFSNILLQIAALFLTYSVILLLFYRSRNSQVFMNRKNVVLLSLLIILLNIVLSSLTMLSDRYGYPRIHATSIDLYNFTAGFLAIFILFGMLERGKLEREAEIINNLYRENVRQYEVSKATMESLHDLKHQVNALIAGKTALTEQERKEITDRILVFDSMVKTGNDTLDIIVSEKKMLCHQYGIDFGCMADGKRLDFIEPHDLYSLFGNALSNAIEAVSKLPEDAPKLIFLSVTGKESYTAIHLENTFSGDLKMEDGIPQTDKQDKAAHGFGVKSMQRITAKYHGTMTITIKDELFHLDILFHRN